MIVRIFLFIIIASTLVSCDSGKSSRSRYWESSSNSCNGPLFNSGFNAGTTVPPGSGSGEAAAVTPTPAPSATVAPSSTGTYNPNSVPADAEGCTWSTTGNSGFAVTSSDLGDYTICESSGADLAVYIQVKNPITSKPLCIIPTSHTQTQQGDSSTYIGEPRCVFINSSLEVYKVELYKNRIGYGSYPITGVMLMKDELEWYGSPYYQYLLNPDAYLFCQQWIGQTQDSSYCYAFDSAGNYTYHQFQAN